MLLSFLSLLEKRCSHCQHQEWAMPTCPHPNSIASRPFQSCQRQPHERPQATSWKQKHRCQPAESWEMINCCCFKPLHLGVFCYTAMNNRNIPAARGSTLLHVPGQLERPRFFWQLLNESRITLIGFPWIMCQLGTNRLARGM